MEVTAPESLEDEPESLDVESSLDADELSSSLDEEESYSSSVEVVVEEDDASDAVVVVPEEDDDAEVRPGSSPSWTRSARTPKTATHEARVPAAKRRREGAGMRRASTPPLNRP